jgi:hypothetical protein
MKEVLRLGFTDTVEPIANFFVETLSKHFQINRDDIDPDYLIFGDKNFGENNLKFNGRCIKIFFTGENQRPWDYQAHYAITFDHFDTDRYYRLPLYVIYDYQRKHLLSERKALDSRLNRKFCSFVVQNGASNMRNNFFYKLSSYKIVDAGGPLFNNIGYVLPRGDTGVEAKHDFLNQYKFNMCFENSSYPGYATEKLYEALRCKTVPIYWGSPTIALDFNPKAFLSWHDYQDDDLFLQAIKRIDQDEDAYREMYMQPMYADNKPNKFMDLDKFVYWFRKNVYKGVIK